jgi:Xaa-Pro aminopeptidase
MSSRGDRAVELLPGAEIDALLVTNLINVRYLTGFTGSNGIVVLGPEARVFVTDFRYVEQSAEQVEPSFDRRRAPQDLIDCIADTLPPGPVRLGFEEADVSVRQHARLRELLPERVELVGVEGMIEGLRAVKDAGEIELMRGAAQLADAALLRLLERGLVGRSERRVALELEQEMRVLGAQQPSFDSIVAAGPHGARPHASPREVEIVGGQLVVIDWGAQLDGYCSDCTRTVAAGEPGDVAAGVYQLVLEAQLAGVAAVRAGADGREVDGVARAVIEAGAHGERFGHGLGHGVGLEVHERPRLSQRSDDVLVTGSVVTVEPGIYLPGDFGVRIEDLVVVTDDGAEILSTVGKELTVVD